VIVQVLVLLDGLKCKHCFSEIKFHDLCNVNVIRVVHLFLSLLSKGGMDFTPIIDLYACFIFSSMTEPKLLKIS